MKYYRQIIIEAKKDGVVNLAQLSEHEEKGWTIEHRDKVWNNMKGIHYFVYTLSIEKPSLMDDYPKERIK